MCTPRGLSTELYGRSGAGPDGLLDDLDHARVERALEVVPGHGGGHLAELDRRIGDRGVYCV